MPLIERLEKRARELDRQVRVGDYNQQAADDRELLLEAANKIYCLREVLKPFAEVPLGGCGEDQRLLLVDADDGPFHIYEKDICRVKEVWNYDK